MIDEKRTEYTSLIDTAKRGCTESALKLVMDTGYYLESGEPIPPELENYLADCISNINEEKVDLNSAFHLRKKRGPDIQETTHRNYAIAAKVEEKMENGMNFSQACVAVGLEFEDVENGLRKVCLAGNTVERICHGVDKIFIKLNECPDDPDEIIAIILGLDK